MAEARNSFPAPNSIRRYVRRELFRRRFNTENSQIAIPTPTIMPFVRFTSARHDPKNHYKFFHLGLHGFPNQDVPNAFGNIFEMSYGDRDVVGYGYGDDGKRKPISSDQNVSTQNEVAAQGKHPIPGITNVRVTHLGANEPIQAVVDWVCYNRTQLEFLRQHFLMAGGYVIVEFGHLFSNRSPEGLFDFSAPDALEKLTHYVVKGRKTMSDELFEPAHGNYNMIIGRVVDQSLEFVADGTIKCSTTVTSTGEAVFGIHNNKLLGRIDDPQLSEEVTRTISDFFQDGGEFDQMLNDPARDPYVIKMRAKSEKDVEQTKDANITPQVLEKFGATDGRFIPWEMFLTDVLGQLFSTIRSKSGVLFNRVSDATLFARINNPNTPEPSVGNHPLLASTDPDTLVIVKPWMVQDTQTTRVYKGDIDKTQRFVKAREGHDPFFVSGSSNEQRGLLSNGVWIHVQALKDSFFQQNTFYESFIHLLTRMNNATQNYWHLDLAFDEELQQYKIYDKKGVFNSTVIPPPYVFNKGTKGELLNLSFAADFSKEAKSAILLSSLPQLYGENPLASKDGGSYNEPSWWTRVLNIPTLHDMLGSSVDGVRQTDTGKQSLETKQADNVGAHRVGPTLQTKSARQLVQEKQERITLLSRFQDTMGPYIVLGTGLIAVIAEDGRKTPGAINNFIAPIPTEIQMSLTMQGISGMAFYDTFLVDKLPRVYEDHGVFLVNSLGHQIDPSGWKTTIGGLYFFVKTDGGGEAADSAVEVSEEQQMQIDLGNVITERKESVSTTFIAEQIAETR